MRTMTDGPVSTVAVSGSTDSLVAATDSATVMRSAVMYKVGRTFGPMKTMGRCHVCTSDSRTAIENALIAGHGPKPIHEALAARGEHISIKSIKTHVKSAHLPLNEFVRRTVLEQRAEEIGMMIDDEPGTILDPGGIFKAVMDRGFERLAMGDIEPEVSDLLAAAKALHTLQAEATGAIDSDILLYAMYTMMEVARGQLEDDVYRRMVSTINSNEELKGLLGRVAKARAIEATAS